MINTECSITSILLITMSIATSVSLPWQQHEPCREPDTNELLRILKSPDSETLPASFLLLPQFRNFTNDIPKSNEAVKIKFHGESDCHVAATTARDNGGNVCPSYHNVHYDPDRIPSTIIQAECSCTQCQRSDTSEERSYGCEKVHSYSQVLRKDGCKRESGYRDAVMQYKKVWESVSIGCTCVYRG